MLGHNLRRQLPASDITMTLDEQRWQKKLARKRKGQNGKRPLPTRSQLHSPASVAHRPIHDSLVAKNIFETGIGMAALARALPNGDVALAAFLVDVYCLGVKDAFYRVVSPDQFAEFVQRFDFEHIHPSSWRASAPMPEITASHRIPTTLVPLRFSAPPRRPRVPCATPMARKASHFT